MKHEHLRGARRALLGAGAALGLSMVLPAARAQGSRWPEKPVRLIVGFPAGTSPDLLARLLAEPLAAEFGQPFIVENRAGAGGNVAAGLLAKATDQHTFGIVGAGTLTSAPALYNDLTFKTSDFAPITNIGSSPLMLVTSTTIKYASVQEFLAIARQAGNKWSYGSPGVGSNGHLSMELLKQRTGIEAVHVPYSGAPAVLTSIIGGDLQMALLPIGNALSQVLAGRIKAVALTSTAPSPLAPGVPTLVDGGVKDFSIETWNTVMAPATASPEIVARFGEVVRRVIRSDDVKQKLFAQGWVADGGSAAELQRRIADDALRYGRIVAERGIRIEK
jgi:tripartite-type tricarboxylate transporter receptor subunit TctC